MRMQKRGKETNEFKAKEHRQEMQRKGGKIKKRRKLKNRRNGREEYR